MKLTRNTKRRLALYGTASVIATLVFALPRMVRAPAGFVIKRIDPQQALEHEAMKLLVEYVRIDTTNPPGKTRQAVELLARLFACEGIPFDIVDDDPDRPIFVARLAGASRQGALLLLHHMDVVPAGDLSLWAEPPFSGALGTGNGAQYLYGRGTLDMKGQGIAFFMAMAALKRTGVTPLHDIVYVAEPGEESFEPERGVGLLLTRHPALLDGVTDALNEGGVNEALGERVARFGIEVLQKGVVKLVASSPDRKKLDAFQATLKARSEELPYRLLPTASAFMRFVAPGRPEWVRELGEPEKALASGTIGRTSETIKGLLKDSIYAGAVRETKEGFEMKISYATLPGTPVAEARARVEGWAKEGGLSIRTEFITDDAVEAPRAGRVWRTLVETLTYDPHEPEASVGPYMHTVFYTNSHYLRAHGISAYGYSPFNVNIGDAAKVHNRNERIHIVTFIEGVERTKRLVLELATSP